MDLQAIRCVLCDVDGVLTDGTLPFTSEGQTSKLFHARDGHVLRLAMRAGLRVGVISGRASSATHLRCTELGMDPIILGVGAKLPVFEHLLTEQALHAHEVAYMGDDYPDLPVMRACGWGVAVGDASAGIKRSADWVCTQSGGRGAVAEALERLLRAQGRWLRAVEAHG